MPTQKIREIMDPQGTLPIVDLEVDPKSIQAKGTLVPTRYLIMSGDQVIGKTTLVERRDRRGREAWFNGVNVDEEYRGRGFGLATYLAAIEQAHANGETFRTHDWTQTQEAARVWERFIDVGVAEVISPLTYSHTEEDGTVKFNAHFQIPPPTTPEALPQGLHA